MKRIPALLFALAIGLLGCAQNPEFKVGTKITEIDNKYMPYITMNALSAYNDGNNYAIIINNGDIVQKLVEFNSERENVRTQGLNLIKCEPTEELLNMDIAELKKMYGQPHVDIGSGFYIPAYITEDAYLISFECEDDIVFNITKRDLLTNKEVECFSKY